MAQDRETFAQLADLRLAEARLLLQNGQSSGAYYLAGFAVECGLKAKIARQFLANEIPDKTLVNSIYSHNLSTLLSLANLNQEHSAAMRDSPALRRSWAVVASWKPEARYSIWSSEDAAAMLDAVEGLMQWLRNHW